LVLINQGKSVLYGSLNDIRKNFTSNVVKIRTPQPLPETIPGVAAIRHTQQNGDYMLTLEEGNTTQSLLKTFINQDIEVEQFEISSPTLDEIFIKIVTQRDDMA
jgi:ABC-2 type transport system ATP-binding protein